MLLSMPRAKSCSEKTSPSARTVSHCHGRGNPRAGVGGCTLFCPAPSLIREGGVRDAEFDGFLGVGGVRNFLFALRAGGVSLIE